MNDSADDFNESTGEMIIRSIKENKEKIETMRDKIIEQNINYAFSDVPDREDRNMLRLGWMEGVENGVAYAILFGESKSN